MAAPERNDLLPMSRGWKPNVASPPKWRQTNGRRCLMKSLVIERVVLRGWVAQMGVDREAVGIDWMIRRTADAQRRMGQRTWSPVLRCVCESIFFPFFWFMNVIVTYSAFWARRGSLWSSLAFDRVRKRIPDNLITSVRPGKGVTLYSQDRMAKKYARQIILAA
jgi:hypothetical protein